MEGPLVWLVLAKARGVGRIRLATLMAAFPEPDRAWRLDPKEALALDGWTRTAVEGLKAVRRDAGALRQAERELESALASGLQIVALPDPDYPDRLRQTPDPPPYLFQAGPWRPDRRPVIGIIGTRKPTPYGLAQAHRFGYELAAAGAVVVSGLARGIDSAAHRGALDAGGTTVAVLGGGADVCYPAEAGPIYHRIRESGAVLSEQPPGATPRREFFPERNRIISGLSHGILVIEAGESSGTLITVGQALEQGRDVFALPGPVTSPMSVGPHRLIREGAIPVASPAELLQDLGYHCGAARPTSQEPPHLPEPEQRILRWMGSGPSWAGDLAEACGMAAGEVQGTLTMLEIKGLARRLPGGQYIRVG